MKIVTTTAPTRLFSGFIGLTESQAKSRIHCLTLVEETDTEYSLFEINHMVSFKKGETFVLEDVPKSISGNLKIHEDTDDDLQLQEKDTTSEDVPNVEASQNEEAPAGEDVAEDLNPLEDKKTKKSSSKKTTSKK